MTMAEKMVEEMKGKVRVEEKIVPERLQDHRSVPDWSISQTR